MKNLSAFLFILLILINISARAEETTEDLQATEAPPVAEEEVQEIKYVTDKLRLSLYKQADSSSGTIKLLVSGDKLAVLGRSGPYSKVRTEKGETGWVKNGFLVTTPTASNLLQDMEAQIEKLESDLGKFSNSKKMMQDYENQLKQLQQDKLALTEQLQASQQDISTLQQQKDEIADELQQIKSRDNTIDISTLQQLLFQFWYVLLALLLIAFVIGLFIGRKIIEARINRRFQGVKVL